MKKLLMNDTRTHLQYKYLLLFLFLTVFLLLSCANKNAVIIEDSQEEDIGFTEKKSIPGNYGIYYQIFVGSFADGNGSGGTGNLRGIINNLDYLNNGNLASNRSLNIDGIWLTPIHPSRTYHKYDVIDYMAIDRSFGTMEDFEELIAEANKRGIKIIIDLVLNHTSSDHPWFIAARRGNPKFMAYYNLADSRISNKYYPLGYGGKFYEGEFWDQMPDLNLDNPDVRDEIKAIVDFWIGKGVAGFRLDAVSKFHTDNHQKNIDFLSWFASYCKSIKDDVYIVAESWESAGIVMSYYDSQLSSLFNFNMSDEKGMIPMAVATQNGVNISTAVVNWNNLIKEKNPNAIDAVFISNHDQNRSAGFFNQDKLKIKMAAALYLTMPGNPFIYYGEEIGMTGRGVDPNKRQPMLWSAHFSQGITRRPPGSTYRFKASAGVYEQLRDPDSISRFYIEAIRMRNLYPVLFYGKPEVFTTGDRNIASWMVSDNTARVAVLHNLSSNEKILDILRAKTLGSALSAGNSGILPELNGNSLKLPPFSTVLIELN